MTRSPRTVLAVAAAAAAIAVVAVAVPVLSARHSATDGAATATGATIYACLTPGHALTRVSFGTPPACPAGQALVDWQGHGQTGQPVPGPTAPRGGATSTPPAPHSSPAGPSPSPDPAGTWNCVTSNAKGLCGRYAYSQITGASSQPWVGQDVWNPISGWRQTLYANDPGEWRVVANMPAGNTAVVSFPNTGVYYGGTLSGYSSMYSSFTETGPGAGGSNQNSYWAAYDLWLNNWANEVMIQNDWYNRGACDMVATATFGGRGGVPVQGWDLCKYGSELIWVLARGPEKSGSVDLLAMLKWLASHGYLPRSSTFTAVSYGFELCSTGGADETFKVTRFSVTAS